MGNLSDYLSVLAIIVAVVAALASVILPIKYGDLAAVKATRKLHEEDTIEARKTAFQSLLCEVTRIRKAVHSNKTLDKTNPKQGLLRLPTNAFERAFILGVPGLSVNQELLEAVTDYLTIADSSNSLIAYYYSLTIVSEERTHQTRRNLFNDVVNQTDQFPNVLNRIQLLLEQELEATSEKLKIIRNN